MATLADKLRERGIRLQRHELGDQKALCPQCSHTRKKKTDPCLSVTVDAEGAIWNCHNHGCGFAGRVSDRNEPERPHRQSRAKPAPVKPKHPIGDATPAVIAWCADRGISEVTVRRNRVGFVRTFVPAREAQADCIAFPYFRGGELVNVKFRTLDGKDFCQVKGAEKILYGLDDIADSKTAYVVEGEPDKLAMEEAGYRNVVSVPDGAPAVVKRGEPDPGDAKFSFLANCAEHLDRLDRIVLAGDTDPAGLALEEELARRLGRERCWRVRWPTGNDAPSKDAGDVLKHHGAEVLRECVEAAEPYPIAGLHRVSEYADDTLSLYRDGRKRGHRTGWRVLDEHMSVVEGQLVVVTGLPNSGKSEFIDALTINLASIYGWRVALCSFENQPAEHISKLAEKHLGLPFWDGPSHRMSEADLQRAIAWCEDHFQMIRADDDSPTIDWILNAAKAAVLRPGIKALVIDPYNEIEHKRTASMSETEYVSQILGKVKRFAQNHGVVVFFVAHPTKMYSDNGKVPVPTLYDISGSANWANKADLGLVVHRPNRSEPITEVHVKRPRSKAFGKEGIVRLVYDRATGRYSEPLPSRRWDQDR
jgi:twinkle protein